MFESLHEQEVCAPFREREYGIAILVHDEIHFSVPETLPVGFCRTIVYACAVTDVRGLGLMPAGYFTFISNWSLGYLTAIQH